MCCGVWQQKWGCLRAGRARAWRAEGALSALEGADSRLNLRQAGVVWYKEPSLLLFFGAKAGLILYILFVGSCLLCSCQLALSRALTLLKDACVRSSKTRVCAPVRVLPCVRSRCCALGASLLTLSNVQASTTHTRATLGPSSNSRPRGGEEQRGVGQTRGARNEGGGTGRRVHTEKLVQSMPLLVESGEHAAAGPQPCHSRDGQNEQVVGNVPHQLSAT